jgi:hypothetical protein
VEVHQCQHRGRKIYLVDTPGFDDTHRSDTDVLREIAAWLGEAYLHQVHLTGIVYLHRITDRRVGGSAIKNLRMFKQLCGDDGLPAVVFATTMWDALREGDETGALARENELISRPEFWGLMLEKGSRVFRQDKGFESATQIMDYLISRQSTVLLDIQHEMAEGSLSLDQTTAGQEVSNDINSRKTKLENDIRELENDMQEALELRDHEFYEVAATVKAKTEQLINTGEKDVIKLRATKEELRQQLDAKLAVEWERLLDDLRKTDAKMARDEFRLKVEQQTRHPEDVRQLKIRLEKEQARKMRMQKEAGELQHRGCLVM